MGTAIVRMKIMPESPDTSLEEIKKQAEAIIKKSAEKGMKITFEEEPIAFGLKALLVQFAIDESVPLERTEERIRKIKHVSSTDIIDFRRAFG